MLFRPFKKIDNKENAADVISHCCFFYFGIAGLMLVSSGKEVAKYVSVTTDIKTELLSYLLMAITYIVVKYKTRIVVLFFLSWSLYWSIFMIYSSFFHAYKYFTVLYSFLFAIPLSYAGLRLTQATFKYHSFVKQENLIIDLSTLSLKLNPVLRSEFEQQVAACGNITREAVVTRLIELFVEKGKISHTPS